MPRFTSTEACGADEFTFGLFTQQQILDGTPDLFEEVLQHRRLVDVALSPRERYAVLVPRGVG